MSGIEFDYISENVNLEEYPKVSGVIDDEQITVGDLHGNALKFIWLLLRHGFVTSISEEDYKRFVEIYNTNINKLDGEDLDDFDEIVKKLQLEPKASQAMLTLLGDELADRGANDYFTLKILQRLNQIGLKYEIVYSNHSFEFLRAYELYKQGKSSFEEVVAKARPTTSLENLQDLIEDNLVKIAEIEEIIETAYKPAFKLLSYTLNQEQNTITINSHAPIDVNIIFEAAEQLNIEFSDATVTDLAQTIDNMNAAFNELVNDSKVSSTVERGDPLYQIMWNRDWKKLDRRSIHNGYHINYVHGHTGGPTEGNVVNLDNKLGKTQHINEGQYTALKRQAEHALINNIKQEEKNTNKFEAHHTLVNGHYYPNTWIEAYDRQHPDNPFNELNEEIISKSGRENLYLLKSAYLRNLLYSLSIVEETKPVEDLIQFGNWNYPADLVAVYNQGKPQYNQFECRALSRTDTFESLYAMLLSVYNRNTGHKYHVSAPYQTYADQELTKEQPGIRSVMGIDIDKEANHALVDFMDEPVELKYTSAFIEIYEYDFKDYMVNQEELNEWLQLKKEGEKIPPILKEVYKQQQTSKSENESLAIETHANDHNPKHAALKETYKHQPNTFTMGKSKIEPVVLETHAHHQNPKRTIEPVQLSEQPKAVDEHIVPAEAENNKNIISQMMQFTLAHPSLTSAAVGLVVAASICLLTLATGGLGLLAAAIGTPVAIQTIATASVVSGLTASGLSFWSLNSHKDEEPPADNELSI